MKKKFLSVLMVLALALGLLAGCSAPADGDEQQQEQQPADGSESGEPAQVSGVLDKILESGKLVVGTEAQYAPYEFKDLDANFVGCDMWLAQQIADALGVELEIVDMSFAGITPAV